MSDSETRSYGAWTSPITARLIAAGSVRLAQPLVEAGTVYWTETRPAEDGRTVIVRCAPGAEPEDLTGPEHSARSRAHEYGGGAFAVRDGVVWFVNDADQDIYRIRPGGLPERVTREPRRRFADLQPDAAGSLVCVAERLGDGEREPVAELVHVEGARGSVSLLHSGRDFYASPRVDAAGHRLAWLAWDHPNMPWDGTELYLAELAPGTLSEPRLIAGSATESVFQPEFGPQGELFFVSDISDWWNLYRWDGEEVRSVIPMQAEFAVPLWQFGMRTYALMEDGRLLSAYTQDGSWTLAWIQREWAGDREQVEPLELGYTAFEGVAGDGTHAACIAAAPGRAPCVLFLEGGEGRILRRAHELDLDPELISRPEPVTFPSGEGQAHAFFYPPANPGFRGPDQERPPLLVKCHGGPTGAAGTALDLRVQYWTSRGFAVVDVNYRGSSGFGRRYRRALYGHWGEYDVEDCAAAARFLAAQRRVDPQRMAISGSSAGGYTVLCALCFGEVFRAGASYYGVSDLETLARDTHKFESHYTDELVAPYPEAVALYRERSPIHRPDAFDCPVIFFQGLEDRVVPPEQAATMVQALRDKRLPVAYLTYPGEGHGFRAADAVAQSLEAELSFYGQVFGFTPDIEGEPVEIENRRQA